MRIVTFCLISLMGSSLWASRNGDLRERTESATSIVMGEVAASRSFYGSDGEIYTEVSVRVGASLKERGRKSAGVRTFQVKGGVVGDTHVVFTDVPSFEADESVMVFFEGDQPSEKYTIRGGYVPELGESAAQVLSKVRQHLDDQQEPMAESERRRAEMFLNQTAAATPPAPDAACFVLLGPKWADALATYKLGTTIPATWRTALDASATSWTRAGTGFQFRPDAASANELLIGTVSGASTLASTRIEFDSLNRIRRFTMTFNSSVSWSTTGEAGKFDVENVTAHELGHALGLNHPSGNTCSEQTMWATAGAGETKKRTLEGGDRAGALSMYPASGTPPTTPPTTPPPAPTAPAPVFTTAYLYPAPRAATPFAVWVIGSGFDPATVQIVFTGPGCATPCVVTPRDRSTTILGAETTLSTRGMYTIALRNGPTGAFSPARVFSVQ
ncbi:MAG: matrixin family metalloprotease [Bryobacteraceae bacterium]|nr:matrixin family metalloprotease [Bryobacteraceae bacterium]